MPERLSVGAVAHDDDDEEEEDLVVYGGVC